MGEPKLNAKFGEVATAYLLAEYIPDHSIDPTENFCCEMAERRSRGGAILGSMPQRAHRDRYVRNRKCVVCHLLFSLLD
jgi:hypothetical protein